MRMGTDKSLLCYHGGLTQRVWMGNILKECCEHVFLSVNEAQSVSEPFAAIVDHPSCKGIGPMAGLISFYHRFGPQDVLLAGCDYPMLTQSDIRNFLQFAVRSQQSCAFFHESTGFYEPTLAWYKKEDAEKIEAQYRAGNFALQFVLQTMQAGKYVPVHGNIIESANTPDQFILSKEKMNAHATQHQ